MRLFHVRVCFAFVAAAFLCNAAATQEPGDKVDEKLLADLQGEWDPVSSIFDGKDREIDTKQKPSFVIEGRTMSIRFQEQVVGKFDIKHLVAKESLGHIDYQMTVPRYESDKVRVKQLFKLEGDKFTTCVQSPPGGERPNELASKVGSKRLLTVSMRRKKP